jgi:hypothetical protein
MNMSVSMQIDVNTTEVQLLVKLKELCEIWANQQPPKPLDDSEFKSAVSRLQSLMVLRAVRRNDKARTDWQLL